MIMYFVLSPLFCYVIEFASFVAFLCIFAYVILRQFCIRITFWEYIIIAWMFAIQVSRIRKFMAMPNVTYGKRFKASVEK